MKIHCPEKSAGKVDKVRVKMYRVSEDGIPSGYRSKSLMTMRSISCKRVLCVQQVFLFPKYSSQAIPATKQMPEYLCLVDVREVTSMQVKGRSHRLCGWYFKETLKWSMVIDQRWERRSQAEAEVTAVRQLLRNEQCSLCSHEECWWGS